MPIVVLVLAVATIVALSEASEAITRMSQVSPVLHGLDVVAGMAMIVGGALAWIV